MGSRRRVTGTPGSVKGVHAVTRTCRLRGALIDCGRGGASLPRPSTLAVLALTQDASLTPAERFALEVLVDLSTVLRCGTAGDVVRVAVVGEARDVTAASLRGRDWGIAAGDGQVTVERSMLRFVADVVGAESEQRSTASDKFGRVPASETRPVREGFAREPVVSTIASALARTAATAAGRRAFRVVDPWPHGKRWAAALTHDLDVVSWWPAFTLLRLAELARHGRLLRAARVARAAVNVGRAPVVWNALSDVLATESRHGVRSSWFVLCGRPTIATMRAGDLTYRPDAPAARRIFDAIHAAGHEIGLHGSFVTSDDHARFAAQRAALRKLVKTEAVGVRQHYLRMRAASTPRGMAAAGFLYDSTHGFADRNGFRLGVADVVPLWDAERQTRVGIDEAPFIWMDRAMSKYQHVEDPKAWIDDALLLADKCQEVNGMWVGIWHPNLAPALGFPDAPAAYARLVRELVSRDAYVAPLTELVAWRRIRRMLRGRVIGESTGVVVTAGGSETVAHHFTIRDAAGRVDTAIQEG